MTEKVLVARNRKRGCAAGPFDLVGAIRLDIGKSFHRAIFGCDHAVAAQSAPIASGKNERAEEKRDSEPGQKWGSWVHLLMRCSCDRNWIQEYFVKDEAQTCAAFD